MYETEYVRPKNATIILQDTPAVSFSYTVEENRPATNHQSDNTSTKKYTASFCLLLGSTAPLTVSTLGLTSSASGLTA